MENLSYFINGFLNNEVSEGDMIKWITKIYANGMTTKQSADYTQIIIDSGSRIKFNFDRPVVDKHSTGGVGDKVSLILGPLLAAYGYYVPMIVGKSLGHTGGTLDKLCAIPGYQPYLDLNSFKKNVADVGVSIMGQTKEICPADKKIYELRDKINMIDSYPLICGSIMSKKIAEGIEGLVLDIKTGNGAFMYNHQMADELGGLLKNIGEMNGLDVEVVITDMSQPLGFCSGIGLEVIESIESLKGDGPPDLMEIVYYLAKKVIDIFEEDFNPDRLKELINSGLAYEKFIQMIEAHGGSMKEFESMKYQSAKYHHIISTKSDGYLSAFQTRRLGELLSEIGAGTLGNDDGIDNYAGLKVYKKISDEVLKDEPILEFYCSSEKKINNLSMKTDSLFSISEMKPNQQKLIY